MILHNAGNANAVELATFGRTAGSVCIASELKAIRVRLGISSSSLIIIMMVGRVRLKPYLRHAAVRKLPPIGHVWLRGKLPDWNNELL